MRNIFIRLYVVGILIAIYAATVFSTCKKSIVCSPNPIYSFSINAQVYPDYDSIEINDTIIIELNELTSLEDLISGSTIDFAQAKNLGTAIAFGEMLGNGQESDALNTFDFVLERGIETGASVNSNRFREYLFKEEGGYYKFKLLIVPKKSGVFRLGLTNTANVFTSNNPCDKASFKITFKDTDQHLYFNQWNFGVTPDLPNGAYCFKVK